MAGTLTFHFPQQAHFHHAHSRPESKDLDREENTNIKKLRQTGRSVSAPSSISSNSSGNRKNKKRDKDRDGKKSNGTASAEGKFANPGLDMSSILSKLQIDESISYSKNPFPSQGFIRCVADATKTCIYCHKSMRLWVNQSPCPSGQARLQAASVKGINLERDMNDTGLKEVLETFADPFIRDRTRILLWWTFRPYSLQWVRNAQIPTCVEAPSLNPPPGLEDPYLLRKALNEACLRRIELIENKGDLYGTLLGDTLGIQRRDSSTCDKISGHDLLLPFESHEIIAWLSMLYLHHARTWGSGKPIVLVNTTVLELDRIVELGKGTSNPINGGMTPFFKGYRGAYHLHDPHPAFMESTNFNPPKFNDVDLFVRVCMVPRKRMEKHLILVLVHPKSRLVEAFGPTGDDTWHQEYLETEFREFIKQQCKQNELGWKYVYHSKFSYNPTLDPLRITTTLQEAHLAIYHPNQTLSGKLLNHQAQLDDLNPDVARQTLWIRGKQRLMLFKEAEAMGDMMFRIKEMYGKVDKELLWNERREKD